MSSADSVARPVTLTRRGATTEIVVLCSNSHISAKLPSPDPRPRPGSQRHLDSLHSPRGAASLARSCRIVQGITEPHGALLVTYSLTSLWTPRPVGDLNDSNPPWAFVSPRRLLMPPDRRVEASLRSRQTAGRPELIAQAAVEDRAARVAGRPMTPLRHAIPLPQRRRCGIAIQHSAQRVRANKRMKAT